MIIEILNSTRMPPRQRGRYKFINRLNIYLYHHRELYFFVFIVQIASKTPFWTTSQKVVPTEELICFVFSIIYHKSPGGAAVALSQSQINLLLERCCIGVVNQIIDLDNSSKTLPYRRILLRFVGLPRPKGLAMTKEHFCKQKKQVKNLLLAYTD